MAQVSRIGHVVQPPMPGHVLKHMLLQELCLKQAQVAAALGISRPRLNMIFKGRCMISPEIALRLEKVFGIPAESLLKIRLEYELFEERQRISRELERLPHIASAPQLQRNCHTSHHSAAAA